MESPDFIFPWRPGQPKDLSAIGRIAFDPESRRFHLAEPGGWTPVTPEAAGRQIRRTWPEAFPSADATDAALVFVSDDGSRADHRKLGPLARDGVPFTLSLVRDFLEGKGREDCMRADEVDQMVSWGCEVAAHGLTHRPLASMEPARMEEEVDGSIEYLRKQGWPLHSFVFPFGSFNIRLRKRVWGHGLAGCLTHGGPARGHFDPSAIPRVAFGSFFRPGQGSDRFYRRLVDATRKRKGVLVFMLHPEEPAHDEAQQAALVRVVQHARATGLPILGLGELVRTRRPLWEESPRPWWRWVLGRDGELVKLWTGGTATAASAAWVTRESPLGPLLWKTRGRMRRWLGRTGKYKN